MPLLDISDLKMKAGWRDSQIPPDPSSKTAASKHRQNKERLKSILGSAARSMIISPRKMVKSKEEQDRLQLARGFGTNG